MVLRTKITTENHQSISFHLTYVYEGPISHRLLSPLRHILRKYIDMLYSYVLTGTGCFPDPGIFRNVSNYNNYISVYYRICVFCSYVLCSLKCATLCIEMLMCFNKLLLTLTFWLWTSTPHPHKFTTLWGHSCRLWTSRTWPQKLDIDQNSTVIIHMKMVVRERGTSCMTGGLAEQQPSAEILRRCEVYRDYWFLW